MMRSPSNFKILIIGHGRSGKDTFADALAEKLNLKSVSSSKFVARKAVYPLLADLYHNWQECYDDRRNNRELWFHAIAAYNLRPGPSLAEQILDEHDIYVGMRSRAEFEKTSHLFARIVWVERPGFSEPDGSMELTRDDADYIIMNNGDLDDLATEVLFFVNSSGCFGKGSGSNKL